MKKIFFLLLLLTFSAESFAQKKPTKKTEETVATPATEAIKVDAISPKQLATSGFADTVEELLPAVVNISATQEVSGSAAMDSTLLGELPKTPLFDELRNQLENQFRNQEGKKKKVSSIGSGFLISKDGFIVTNSHVIEDSDEILVNTNDGGKYKAKIIGIDKKTDLALLKISSEKDFKFVKFGDSSKARIGDWLIVVGNPYGLGGSVSVGIISARGRDINNGQSDDFIQTDAAINKGNSGGPVFNAKGEVIGVSTAIFSPSGGNVGIGFATPSSTAAQVVKQLKEQGEVTRGWLGVSIQDVTDEIAESIKMDKAQGAFVVEVVKDGPADKAGIIPTDIITKFDDQEITEMKILPKTVAKYPVGKSAKITVLRRGKYKTFTVKVAKMTDEDIKRPDSRPSDKKSIIKPTAQLLGLGLVDLNDKIKKSQNLEQNLEGILIVDVNPKSEAAEKSMMPGDVILSVNQTPVKSMDNLKEAVEEAKKSTKKLFLFVKRGENNFSVVLTLK